MARQRYLAALAVAAATAALAPSAAAQPRPVRIPDDAAVVAGPTASGARLLAFDRGRDLCTAFVAPDRPRRFAYASCERPRLLPRHVPLAGDYFRRRSFHYGLVRPDVAAAELVFEGGTARAPASDGSSYTGRYAGKLRFLLIEVRGSRLGVDPHEGYLRLFDESGGLLRIANVWDAERVRERPAKELARGTTSGVPWSLRAYRERRLTPLPGNEERFVDDPCVEVWRRGPARGERTLASVCLDPDNPRVHDSYVFEHHCARIGYAGVGTVEPDVRSVVAVLGDGSLRRARLRRLPATHGPGRAFALVLPKSVAIRRLVALKADGRRELIDRARGPGSIRCTDSGVLYAFYGYEPVKPTGPTAFTVYDDGALLCATLGRPTRHPGECQHPPLDVFDSWILTRRKPDGRLLAGIVPGEIARVVVRMADGTRVPLDTTAGGFYAGQYAGRVRFFTLDLEPGERVHAITLIDAGGTRLLSFPHEDQLAPAGRSVVIGGPPGLRLRARRYGSRDPIGGYLCIGLAAGACEPAYSGIVSILAQCNPRRLVLWGALSRGQTGLTVETDRGPVAARLVRIPRRLRSRTERRRRSLERDAAVSAYVAVLPPRARPTAVVISGRRITRRRVQLPPASAQCGYDDDLFL